MRPIERVRHLQYVNTSRGSSPNRFAYLVELPCPRRHHDRSADCPTCPFLLTRSTNSAMLTSILREIPGANDTKGKTVSALAKFSNVGTKLQVGTAAVALVAAAVITPAVAEAKPAIAPVSNADTYSVSDLTLLPGGLSSRDNGSAAVAGAAAGAGAAARVGVNAFNPIVIIGGTIQAVVHAIATLVYNGSQFVIKGLQWVANEFARVFRVGPYSQVG